MAALQDELLCWSFVVYVVSAKLELQLLKVYASSQSPGSYLQLVRKGASGLVVKHSNFRLFKGMVMLTLHSVTNW